MNNRHKLVVFGTNTRVRNPGYQSVMIQCHLLTWLNLNIRMWNNHIESFPSRSPFFRTYSTATELISVIWTRLCFLLSNDENLLMRMKMPKQIGKEILERRGIALDSIHDWLEQKIILVFHLHQRNEGYILTSVWVFRRFLVFMFHRFCMFRFMHLGDSGFWCLLHVTSSLLANNNNGNSIAMTKCVCVCVSLTYLEPMSLPNWYMTRHFLSLSHSLSLWVSLSTCPTLNY